MTPNQGELWLQDARHVTSLNTMRWGSARAAIYAFGYTGWIMAFHLLTLTLVTFLLRPQNFRLQDISDAYGANEIPLAGIGALLFVIGLRLINPITSVTRSEIITVSRVKLRYLPGVLQGAILAIGMTVSFSLSGLYQSLGAFIQAEDPALAAVNVILRIGSLIALVYCEEFIFRHKILHHLRKQIPEIHAVLITAALYALLKALQFDLGLRQVATLFLAGTALGFRATAQGDFARGAGLFTGMLILIHPAFSLPIFGNEFHGAFMVKYDPGPGVDGTTARLITGGAGGPLSSLALQLLFLFDIAQCILKNRKVLFITR